MFGSCPVWVRVDEPLKVTDVWNPGREQTRRRAQRETLILCLAGLRRLALHLMTALAIRMTALAMR